MADKTDLNTNNIPDKETHPPDTTTTVLNTTIITMDIIKATTMPTNTTNTVTRTTTTQEQSTIKADLTIADIMAVDQAMLIEIITKEDPTETRETDRQTLMPRL